MIENHETQKNIRAASGRKPKEQCRGLLDGIEELRQEAKRGPLNYWQIKMLKLFARHFPKAQKLFEKCSPGALKRKSFVQIVKETPRLEVETDDAWLQRIWDEYVKYGTEIPRVERRSLRAENKAVTERTFMRFRGPKAPKGQMG